MCPKSKPTETVLHRIELQQTERDALEMVAASMTVRNLGEGVGSILSPFLQMTPTSGVLFGSVLGIAVAQAAADKALDVINPEGVGGIQTRIATSPWFIAWVADVQNALK
jgi:nitrogen-specific signal transduction histidine kinase